jgi:hypothetical protein
MRRYRTDDELAAATVHAEAWSHYGLYYRYYFPVKTPQVRPVLEKAPPPMRHLWQSRAGWRVCFFLAWYDLRNPDAGAKMWFNGHFFAVSVFYFGFQNQSPLPRRLVPNTFAGVWLQERLQTRPLRTV